MTSAAEHCSGALLSGWAAAAVTTCGGVCRWHVVVAEAHEWSCVRVAVREIAAAARTERSWGWSLAAAVALAGAHAGRVVCFVGTQTAVATALTA